LAFAHGGAESPGETRSRVALLRAGVAVPRLQRAVYAGTGRLVGRVDFDWDEHATVGEFDGEVMYERELRPGQDLGEVVFREKVREDALRDTGRQVVLAGMRADPGPRRVHGPCGGRGWARGAGPGNPVEGAGYAGTSPSVHLE
jgi:hypothetical protein